MKTSVISHMSGASSRWRSTSVGGESYYDGDNDSLADLDRDASISMSMESQALEPSAAELVSRELRQQQSSSVTTAGVPASLNKSQAMEHADQRGAAMHTDVGHRALSGMVGTDRNITSGYNHMNSETSLGTSAESSVPPLSSNLGSEKGFPKDVDVVDKHTVVNTEGTVPATEMLGVEKDNSRQIVRQAFDPLTELEDEGFLTDSLGIGSSELDGVKDQHGSTTLKNDAVHASRALESLAGLKQRGSVRFVMSDFDHKVQDNITQNLTKSSKWAHTSNTRALNATGGTSEESHFDCVSEDEEDESEEEIENGGFASGENADLVDPPTLNPRSQQRKPVKSYADDGPVPRVKLLCSHGGMIVPRPGDGKLRYVGGESRIMVFNRNIQYSDLMSKMMAHYGHALSLRYQLPNEDLDALVSVFSDEDLDHMMDEYDQLAARLGGQARLRVFLFNAADIDPHASGGLDSGGFTLDVQYARYLDAINRGSMDAFRFDAPSKSSHDDNGDGPLAPSRDRKSALDLSAGSGIAPRLPPPQAPPFVLQENLSMPLMSTVSQPAATLEKLAPTAKPLVHSRSAVLLADGAPLDASAHGSPGLNSPRQVARGHQVQPTGQVPQVDPHSSSGLAAYNPYHSTSVSAHAAGFHGLPMNQYPASRVMSTDRFSGPPSGTSSKPGSPSSPIRSRQSPSSQAFSVDYDPPVLALPESIAHAWHPPEPNSSGSGPGTPLSEDVPIGLAPPSPRRQRELEQARMVAHEVLGGHNYHPVERTFSASVAQGRRIAGGPSHEDLHHHFLSQQDLLHAANPPPDIRRQMDLPKLNVGSLDVSRRRTSGPPSPRLHVESPRFQGQRQQLSEHNRSDPYHRGESVLELTHQLSRGDMLSVTARPWERQVGLPDGPQPMSTPQWNQHRSGEPWSEQAAAGGFPVVGGANVLHGHPASDGRQDLLESKARVVPGGMGAGGYLDRSAVWQGERSNEDESHGRNFGQMLPSAAQFPGSHAQQGKHLDGSYVPVGGGVNQNWQAGGDLAVPHSVSANDLATRGAHLQQHQQHHLGRVVSMQDQLLRQQMELPGGRPGDGVAQARPWPEQRLSRENGYMFAGDEHHREDLKQLGGEAGPGNYAYPPDPLLRPGHLSKQPSYGAPVMDSSAEHQHEGRMSGVSSPRVSGLFQDPARWQTGGLRAAGFEDGPRHMQQPLPEKPYAVQRQLQQHGEGVGSYPGRQFLDSDDRPYIQRPGEHDDWANLKGERGVQGGHVWEATDSGLGSTVGQGRLHGQMPYPAQNVMQQQPAPRGRYYDEMLESHPQGLRRVEGGIPRSYEDESYAIGQHGEGGGRGGGVAMRSGLVEGPGAGRTAVPQRQMVLPQDMQRDMWGRNDGPWEGGPDRLDGPRDGEVTGNWGARFLEQMKRGAVLEHGDGPVAAQLERDLRERVNSGTLSALSSTGVGQSGNDSVRDLTPGPSANQMLDIGSRFQDMGMRQDVGVWAQNINADTMAGRNMWHQGVGRNDVLEAGPDAARQRPVGAWDDQQRLPVSSLSGHVGAGKASSPPEGYITMLRDAKSPDQQDSFGNMVSDRAGGSSTFLVNQMEEGKSGLSSNVLNDERWERMETFPPSGQSTGRGMGLGIGSAGVWATHNSGVARKEEGMQSAPVPRADFDEQKNEMRGHAGDEQLRAREGLHVSAFGTAGYDSGPISGDRREHFDPANAFRTGSRAGQFGPPDTFSRQGQLPSHPQLLQQQSARGSGTIEWAETANRSDHPDMIQWGPDVPVPQTPAAALEAKRTASQYPAPANYATGYPVAGASYVNSPSYGSPPAGGSRPVGLENTAGKLQNEQPCSSAHGMGDAVAKASRQTSGSESPFSQPAAFAAPGATMSSVPKAGFESEDLLTGPVAGGLAGARIPSTMFGSQGRSGSTVSGQLGEARSGYVREPSGSIGVSTTVPPPLLIPAEEHAALGVVGSVGGLPAEGVAPGGARQQSGIYGADKYGEPEPEISPKLKALQSGLGSTHVSGALPEIRGTALGSRASAGGNERTGRLSVQLANSETLANDVASSVLGSSPGQSSGILGSGHGSPVLSGQASPAAASPQGAMDIPKARFSAGRGDLGALSSSRGSERHVAEDVAASVLGVSPLGKSPVWGGEPAGDAVAGSGVEARSSSQLGQSMAGSKIVAVVQTDGTPQEHVAVPEEVQRAFQEVPVEEPEPDKQEVANPGITKDVGPQAEAAEAEAIAAGLQTIPNADLEELRELGSGTYGTVYHGKWNGTDVAIKRIKASVFQGHPSEQERLVADFWKEACNLGVLHHPNVVAFYGVVKDHPDRSLATVTEYMVNGSLKQVLQKKDRSIDRRKRILIAMDAAFGMEYLHKKNIVHFDLKCDNLLVNLRDAQRPICKVGDLGLAKVKHKTMVSGGVRGTLPWMAPELLDGRSSLVTEKVDVFSFGICMWELLTGEEPYASMHYGAIIGGILNNTLRPPIPSWCDPAWKSLMERCWNREPALRPTFQEVANELRTMATALQLHK